MGPTEQPCECLAAWVDTEPCICGEMPGAPMELSAKRLSEAKSLADDIASMDRAAARLKPGKTLHGVRVDFGQHEMSLHLYLPDDIIAGLIRTMRRHAMIKLAATGVVSNAAGHRPVLS